MVSSRAALVHPILCLAGLAVSPGAHAFQADVTKSDPTQERRSSLVQRGYPTGLAPWMPLFWGDGPGVDDPATFPDEYRTINGRFNNLARPWLGSAGIAFTRVVEPAYGDPAGLLPARMEGASPRAISQVLADQGGISMLSVHGDTNLMWLWGQFLDHDIDETPIAKPKEPFDISIPSGDPWFDPMGTGTVRMALDRSGYQMISGRREQVNNITAFIDASMVYGSDAPRAAELRALDGTGRLKTSEGDLMPFNLRGFPTGPDPTDPTLFLSGDVRTNENVALIAIHTVFMREHNYWADRFRDADPTMSDDDIYEHARAIIGGIVQAITYREYLPLLLGMDAIPPYMGYDPDVDPGISNLFATAAFRMGHSQLDGVLARLNADGSEAPEGNLSLADAFFNPGEIVAHGIDSVLRGVTMTQAQQLDTMLVGEVRNFLFGPPGAGGFDLAALNIQRGRDHGLPGYNAVRAAFGLPMATSFLDLNPDPIIAGKLASVYATCDDIDPWVGMLAEPHVPGAMVGETLRAVLADQFRRLRDGDRFWYESYLPADLVDLVNAQTMATVLRRTTGLDTEIGEVPFFMPNPCPADLDGDGELTVADFVEYQRLFAAGDSRADFDGDGVLTFFDFLAYLNAFQAGCP